MAANLDIGELIEASQPQNDPTQIQKYCLNDDPAMCDAYGGLYQWDRAMQYTEEEGAPGICPAEWRICTDQDWRDLEVALGMDPAVADQDNWRGAPVGTALKVGGSSGFEAPSAVCQSVDSFTTTRTTVTSGRQRWARSILGAGA